jgi:hypothetical protein
VTNHCDNACDNHCDNDCDDAPGSPASAVRYFTDPLISPPMKYRPSNT